MPCCAAELPFLVTLLHCAVVYGLSMALPWEKPRSKTFVNAWYGTVYAVSTVLALVMLQDVPSDVKIGQLVCQSYSSHTPMVFTFFVRAQTVFYLLSACSHVWGSERTKRSRCLYVIHHVGTVVLMETAHAWNLEVATLTIVASHYASDPFLHAGKVLRSHGYRRAGTWCMAVFAVLFISLRLPAIDWVSKQARMWCVMSDYPHLRYMDWALMALAAADVYWIGEIMTKAIRELSPSGQKKTETADKKKGRRPVSAHGYNLRSRK